MKMARCVILDYLAFHRISARRRVLVCQAGGTRGDRPHHPSVALITRLAERTKIGFRAGDPDRPAAEGDIGRLDFSFLCQQFLLINPSECQDYLDMSRQFFTQMDFEFWRKRDEPVLCHVPYSKGERSGSDWVNGLYRQPPRCPAALYCDCRVAMTQIVNAYERAFGAGRLEQGQRGRALHLRPIASRRTRDAMLVERLPNPDAQLAEMIGSHLDHGWRRVIDLLGQKREILLFDHAVEVHEPIRVEQLDASPCELILLLENPENAQRIDLPGGCQERKVVVTKPDDLPAVWGSSVIGDHTAALSTEDQQRHAAQVVIARAALCRCLPHQPSDRR